MASCPGHHAGPWLEADSKAESKASVSVLGMLGPGPGVSLFSITGTVLRHQDMSQEEGNSTSHSWQV